MASRSLLLRSCFLLFFCLSTSTAFSGKTKKKLDKPCKRLVLYLHDIGDNGKNTENATAATIIAPDWANKTIFANKNFGTLVVFDDPVTLGISRHSSPVGRAQGFYIYDDMKAVFPVWISFSILFDSEDYKGIINFGGADVAMNKQRDISVIGGTGDFVMTRGIATLMTDAYDESLEYTRLIVDIKLYECWQLAPDAE